MKVGIVGLGRIGAMHAGILRELPGVDALVVTDPVEAAVARAVSELGADAAASPKELLADVDAVLIAAATDAHPELLVAAVDVGVPAFCEKPLARDIADAVAVAERVGASGVPVQVGYNRRFDPAVAAARVAVASGELGRVHTVRSTTLDPAPPPAAYVATSGGIFRDCSVHDFDTVRFVTGREVVEVYATGDASGDPVFAASDDVSTASALLTLDDGAIAVVSNSRYNGRGYDVRLEVHGERDSVAVGWDDKVPMRSLEPGATFPAGPPHDFFLDRFTTAYRVELAAFLDVARGRRPSPCTVADAVAASWIAEACTRSLREHRPVQVTRVP